MQFTTEDAVAEYVEREIARALPTGWSSTREARKPLVWQITPDKPTTSAPHEDYRLRVTDDLKLFVIEYGNSDVGGLSLYHVLLNAKVIDADALDHFPLSDAISDVITQCRPNEWGWT